MVRASQRRALARLHARIQQCDRCPLHRTRTQAVPGAGAADAMVMFVGEAPGRQEDLTGAPFVGAAGRFLDKLLASAGISRGAVYITNVVKSRPFRGISPGRNRAPSPDEIAACRPWLDEQVQLIRPSVVVTLGQIALEHFLPGHKLADVHGRALRRGTLTIVPLYHPAMSRYGQKWKALLRREFRRVAGLVGGPRRAARRTTGGAGSPG